MKGEPMRKLTKEQKRDIRALAAKRDEDIDFSDVPLVLDWSGAEIGKFYRPKKNPVTMRLDSDVMTGSKLMVVVIKPKRIGCCGTPCFI
jgi:hypothetical protein